MWAKSPPCGLFMRLARALLPASLPVSGASAAAWTGSSIGVTISPYTRQRSAQRPQALGDRFAARLDHEPEAAELVDVVAEHLPGAPRVAVERVAGVDDLGRAVVALGRPEQPLVGTGTRMRLGVGGHRRPGLGAGSA